MGAKASVFFYSALAFGLQIILLKIFEYLLLFTNVTEALPLGLLGASIGTISAALALKKYPEIMLEKWGLAALAVGMIALIPNILLVAHFWLVLNSIFCSAALGFLVALNLIGRRFRTTYVFEILGSACGVLLVWAMLPHLGAELLFFGSILLVAILAAWKRAWPALVITASALVLVSAMASRGFSIDLIHRIQQTTNILVPDGARMVLRQNQQANLVSTKWSMLDRVDAIKFEDSISLFFNDRAWSSYRPHERPVFPYSPQAKSALVVGVGAGRDIRDLKAAGVKRIVGAEISPEVVELMRGPLYELTDKIYDSAEVQAVNGRNLMRRSREKFDIILSHYPDLMTGGKISHALSENYLWTEQSFQEFFEHLSPGGQFIFSRTIRDERPATFLTFQRYLASLSAGMQRAGVNAKDHAQVFLTRPHEGQYKFHFVVKKSNFTSEEESLLANFFQNEITVIKPNSPPQPPPSSFSESAKSSYLLVQQLFLEQSKDWQVGEKIGGPATDDRPFLEYVREHTLFSSFLMNVMLGTLISFVVALVFFQNRPSSALRANPGAQLHCFFSGTYFCLIEIYLIRRLNFYFGIPVQNMAFVLLTLLIGASIPAGLLAGRRELSRPEWLVALSPVAALAFFILEPVIAPLASERLAYGLLVLFILPIGIFSSVLFPYIGRKFPEDTGVLYALNLLGFFFGAAVALSLGLEIGNRSIFFVAVAITAIQCACFIFGRRERSLFQRV